MPNDDKFDVYLMYGGAAAAAGGDRYDLNREIANHFETIANLLKLKMMREMVVAKMEEDRRENKSCSENESSSSSSSSSDEADDDNRLADLVRDWEGQYPDLRKMFDREQMDWLLKEYASSATVLGFVVGCGYRDEPEPDEDGKIALNRVTPVHRAFGQEEYDCVPELFKIYKYDVNYIDERSGLTHFHVACEYGLSDVVEKFLRHGQDPDCLPVRSTVDPPLHLALMNDERKVVELLLRAGADPNLANAEGETPLHAAGQRENDDDLEQVFFDIDDAIRRRVRVDARDRSGNAPLHLALANYAKSLAELLLRNGADPNLANDAGETPLHVIGKDRDDAHELARMLFEISDERRVRVEVDARDESGRTPLQWAVANLVPKTVAVLLERGADLSAFRFPTEDYLFRDYFSFMHPASSRATAGALDVLERLERRGYEPDRGDVLTIMKLFAKHKALEKSAAELDESSWMDDQRFADRAKKMKIADSDLTLYDLIRLPACEAARLLPPRGDYLKFMYLLDLWKLPDEHKQATARRLCEAMSRRFFRRWATTSLMELVEGTRRYRLPILCCDMIAELLDNEDSWRVCLAAAGQSLPTKSVQKSI
ncbi:ankyrin repeat and SOCS box protein 2-like [Trichogramma pretiosum]|uniref:ankyrin repeat and SOCS box protein 2-like n=1 Tax=Trichogramma pretiosum TaxID=7493 RepID=UPI000C7191CF|nr:ankyrin repeat and SOCS box protein 2-like [Trichogramma pretiosum]